MNDRIRKLLLQIETLKRELQTVLKEQEQEILYRVEGTRIEFEDKLKQTHQELKEGVFSWLRSSEPRNVLSAPFIYGMFVPVLFMDLSLTLYQQVCFRLYRIPRVSRKEYLVFDRHHLAYLNLIQKINCVYCAYVNGVISYAREITSRTEQYWCPIKHARKVADPHERYLYFVPFGDAEGLQRREEALRDALSKEEMPSDRSSDQEPPKS